jgi:tetratricopeptide (TPR) repeat protein
VSDLGARDRWLVAAIVAVALVVRIAYLVDVSDSPYFRQPLLDSCWYDNNAKAIADGDWLSSSGSFRVPLYSYFLAGSYLVFGHSFVPPLAVQAILGSLTCGLVFLMGRRLFGRLAGAVAGFGLALYRMAVYSDGELLPTTLYILFTVLAVYFLLRIFSRSRDTQTGGGSECRRGSWDGTWGGGALVGLLLGLAYLTRPEVLVFAVALGVVALAVTGKRAFRVVALMGIVLVMTTLAMGLRNRAIFGEFFLFSPQGATNLYIGNARYSQGKSPTAPPTLFPYGVTADPKDDAMVVGCKQAARERVGRNLSDRELSAHYTRETFAEIGRDFPRWVGLVARKTYYLLNAYEISDIKYLPRYVSRYSRVLKMPLVGYALVMPLGLVGFGLVARRRIKQAWLINAALMGAGVTCIVFFVVWRFRLPAVPFLAILAGYAVSEMVTGVRARAWKSVLTLMVPAVLLGLVSLSNLWGVRADDEEATYIDNEAAMLALDGKTEQAIEVYKEAIAADPANARAYYYMGKAYGTLGLADQARNALAKAAALNPSYRPFTLLSTGNVYAKQGDFLGASECFRLAIQADPGFAMAYYNYGFSLYKLGRHPEAERAFLEAERLSGGDTAILLPTAQMLVEMGRVERGAAMARAVLGREPRNGKAHFILGLSLDSQDRLDEARAQFEAALACAASPEEAQEARQKLIGLRARQTRR